MAFLYKTVCFVSSFSYYYIHPTVTAVVQWRTRAIWKAGSASIAAPFQRRSGAGTVRVITSATPAVSITR